MWDMNFFGGGLMMLFGGIFMLVFWGGLIALIVWGIIRLTKRSDSTPTHSPLDIAKERYAKGEINKEEFEQIKKDLY
jgi:putative membrane protein